MLIIILIIAHCGLKLAIKSTFIGDEK